MGFLDSASAKNSYEFKSGQTIPDVKFPIQPGSVLGIPYFYNDNADYNRRVFTKTLAEGMNIVTFMVGEPKFVGLNGNDEEAVIENLKLESEGAINSFLGKNPYGNKDYRYYTFNPNMKSYFEYLQILLSTVYIRMKLGYMIHSSTVIDKFKNSGIAFYAQASGTALSEGVSTSFTPSIVSGALDKPSKMAREASFLLGKQAADAVNEEINAEDLAKDMKAIADGGDSLLDKARILTGYNPIAMAIHGARMIFPDIWDNTTYSNNITISFKFSTPYGNARSIFSDVYVPFLALLAMVLPRQDGIASYGSPFLIRVESNGIFSCDIGYISSMSFKKGGGNNLWSVDGHPREIDVNLTIKDLYPSLMISPSYTMMRSNTSMLIYLNNLSGVRMADLKVTDQFVTWVMANVNVVAGIPDTVSNTVYDAKIKAFDYVNSLGVIGTAGAQTIMTGTKIVTGIAKSGYDFGKDMVDRATGDQK